MNLLNILLLILIIILIILCAYKIIKTCKIKYYVKYQGRQRDRETEKLIARAHERGPTPISMPMPIPPPPTRPGMPPIGARPGGSKYSQRPSVNICMCPGGIAAIGQNCPRRGTIECSECNKGYVMRKRCVRDLTRSPPRVSCPEGTTFKVGKCRTNRCRCYDGLATKGKDCTKYGAIKCYKCYGSRKLINSKCVYHKT
jgi:hypothetical protein